MYSFTLSCANLDSPPFCIFVLVDYIYFKFIFILNDLRYEKNQRRILQFLFKTGVWRPVVSRALTPGAGGTGCGGRVWSSPYSSYRIPPGVASSF